MLLFGRLLSRFWFTNLPLLYKEGKGKWCLLMVANVDWL